MTGEVKENLPTQGEHLARLIDLAGLDNTKLERLSGVPRVTISRIVNDRQGMGADVARRLAPHLSVSVDEVLLPKEQEVESRRSLHRRLEALEDEVAVWKALLREALDVLGLQVDLEADPGSRVQRRTPPRRRA